MEKLHITWLDDIYHKLSVPLFSTDLIKNNTIWDFLLLRVRETHQKNNPHYKWSVSGIKWMPIGLRPSHVCQLPSICFTFGRRGELKLPSCSRHILRGFPSHLGEGSQHNRESFPSPSSTPSSSSSSAIKRATKRWQAPGDHCSRGHQRFCN